jgi:hypothetical protein
LNKRRGKPIGRRIPGFAAGAILALHAFSPALAADGTPSASPPSRQQTDYPVAGLAPYARPAGAPVEHEVRRAEKWRAQALQGVSAPVPASLKFLDDQGAWYTPFDLPGMTGPYDIRGFHLAPSR